MKKILLSIISLAIACYGYGTTWEVTTSGFTFTPATITIQQGDDVHFNLSSSHNAIEVSQATWNANGNSPATGFSVPFGGGTVSAAQLTAGTHYYVCAPHASLGMKGQIIVMPISGLPENSVNNFILYPNPVVKDFNVRIELTETAPFEISLFDLQGKLISVLQAGTQAAGLFSKSFTLTEMTPAGVYLIKMQIGDKSTFKKLVVL